MGIYFLTSCGTLNNYWHGRLSKMNQYEKLSWLHHFCMNWGIFIAIIISLAEMVSRRYNSYIVTHHFTCALSQILWNIFKEWWCQKNFCTFFEINLGAELASQKGNFQKLRLCFWSQFLEVHIFLSNVFFFKSCSCFHSRILWIFV